MKRAQTTLIDNNNLYHLSNRLIINCLINQGLNIDSRIINNMYFQYKLFNIFNPIKTSDIKAMSYSNHIITIDTNRDTYQIEENSEGGLILRASSNTNTDGSLFVNTTGIYQIFPLNAGILITEHYKSIISNISYGVSEKIESLDLKFIDQSGLVQVDKISRIAQNSNDFSFNTDIDISPLLSREYLALYDEMYNNEKSVSTIRKRDSKNILKLSEYRKDSKIETCNIKYFQSYDLFDVLDINSFYQNREISYNKIYQQLLEYNQVDNVIGQIISIISNKCGFRIEKYISEIENQSEVKLIDDLLRKPKTYNV